MSVAIKKVKLYVKLVLIALVVIMVVWVLAKNYNRQADVWFFKAYEDVNVLKLLLYTAIISIISFWILTTGFKLTREWREVSKQVAHQEKLKQLDSKADELSRQEQRIDDKINRALGETPDE
jgi:type VI protein secretion system component VasK